MLKQLIALTLAFCLAFSVCAAGEAADDPKALTDARVEALALVSQKEPRLQSKRFKYNNAELSVRGCGPCCIVNMLIAAYDVQDEDTSDLLLYETLRLLCGKADPATRGINVKYLKDLPEPDAERFPTLLSVLDAHGGAVTYAEAKLDCDTILAGLADAMAAGAPHIAMSRLTLHKNWDVIFDLCQRLLDAGYGDADVIVGFITGGTASTSGPLRSSDGHYFSVLLRPDLFLTDYSLYLLDSLPRALADEPYHNRVYYNRYPFTVGGGVFKIFRETFDVVRLQPTALRFTPNAEALAAFDGLEGSALLNARIQLMQMILTYGEGVLMISLPSRN